ncbi:DUF6188 family protein [Streptomyces sp. LHD-70]|uniref:DUF6188 family protein n=1 Tax=Streptomyces sp. LHD-70 TaxID=3072140 RepID=UPI0035BE1E05
MWRSYEEVEQHGHRPQGGGRGIGEGSGLNEARVKSGVLNVNFADGSVLRVAADDEFEAWQLSASAGHKIVSVPGGGLAVWRR